MKYLTLSNSSDKVLVDDDCFELLSKRKWRLNSGGYPSCSSYLGNYKRGLNLLAHWVMGAKKGQYVDHINGNKLDNRRENLRFCTLKQNGGNRTVITNNKSGYKGITRDKHNKKWQVYCAQKYIGVYTHIEDAVKAYNSAAKERWGDFARLNKA